MTRIKEALRKCINAEEILTPDIKNLETAESKLELAKDKASWKDYEGFLDAIQISKEVYDTAYEAKDSLNGKLKYYENTHSKRVRNVAGMFFAVVGIAMLIGLVCSPIGGCAWCNIGDKHHQGHNYLIR
ncbi:MAG: hypothetical protein QG641_1724, partial [Candidatus Poribacteria bacterium]|nr:hypothetical protein [Candidatus Poribacteria bacterium]MDQ1328439.1 hypothetical protein [Candidatus Poribacteria bacterium]